MSDFSDSTWLPTALEESPPTEEVESMDLSHDESGEEESTSTEEETEDEDTDVEEGEDCRRDKRSRPTTTNRTS